MLLADVRVTVHLVRCPLPLPQPCHSSSCPLSLLTWEGTHAQASGREMPALSSLNFRGRLGGRYFQNLGPLYESLSFTFKLGLPDLANKNAGHSIKFEFQINDKLSQEVFETCNKKTLVCLSVSLKFKYNPVSHQAFLLQGVESCDSDYTRPSLSPASVQRGLVPHS